MPPLSSPEIIESNGHRQLDTDLVTIERSSTQSDSNKTEIQDSEIQESDSSSSPEDWSYVTKELLDALPQRWTRGLLYLILLFVGVALPWSMLSKVDETGIARGRLEPLNGTVKQETDFTETVKKIHVDEGDTVEAGEVLIEFETRQVEDRLQPAQIKLEGQKNQLKQLQKQQNQLEIELGTQQRQNQSQQLEKLAQVEQARQNMESLRTVYNLQKEEKMALVHQAQQNLDALKRASNLQREENLAKVSQAKQHLRDNKTAYQLTEIRWKKAQREVERYRQIWEEGVIPEIQVIEKEDISEERQQLWEQARADFEQAQLRLEEQQSSYERIVHQAESDIEQAQLRLEEQQSGYERTVHQAESEIEQAQLRLEEQENSYQTIVHSGEIAVSKIREQLKNIETQKTTLKSEIAQTEKEIDSLNFELERRILKAQASGTIFNLPVETAGEVVQQGEMLVEIAPKGTHLLLKAQMATSESGSLRKDMRVKMKFDAYPFQDYGIVEGTLKSISPTSKVRETPEGDAAIYELEIGLNQTCISAATECIVLRPGDTATAEVVVRQRRVIDFILDPFKKLKEGGVEL